MKEIAREILGYPGRMVSGSKSGYRRFRPLHLVVFNSNVVVNVGDKPEKIWYGDIDLTESENAIKELASKLGGVDVYVLREMDARFENEHSPRIDNYVYTTDGKHGGYNGDLYCRYYPDAPEPLAPEGSLVQREVAENWELQLSLKEPPPSEEDIDKQVKWAKAQWKEEDFEKVYIGQKNFNSFLENCTHEISPFDRFKEYCIELGVKLVEDNIYSYPVLNEYDHYCLYKAQKAWQDVLRLSFNSVNDYNDPKTWGPDNFFGGPKDYNCDPDWAEEEYMYVRKKSVR